MFVLSDKVGSLVTVATLAGGAFLFGGPTQLVVASGVPAMPWLCIVGGILGVAAGTVTFIWSAIPLYVVSIMLAWYLIVRGTIHIVSSLAGPKLSWSWIGLLLRIFELLLEVCAARSGNRSLTTLVALIRARANSRKVTEICAGFTLRQVGKQQIGRAHDRRPIGQCRERSPRGATGRRRGLKRFAPARRHDAKEQR
jgi:Short repeat of unknown function (DUF308)